MTILKFLKVYPRILNLPKPDLDTSSLILSLILLLSLFLARFTFSFIPVCYSWSRGLFAFRISQIYRGKLGYISVALISAVAKDILVGGKNEKKSGNAQTITQLGDVMIIHYFIQLSLPSPTVHTKAMLLSCRDYRLVLASHIHILVWQKLQNITPILYLSINSYVMERLRIFCTTECKVHRVESIEADTERAIIIAAWSARFTTRCSVSIWRAKRCYNEEQT